MCGICGQYNFGSRRPISERTISQMTGSLAHRGPDDVGTYITNEVGLGFRRLSIIDLEGGHQPMTNAAETVWVVLNGEIYNFPELRTQLQGCGHVFSTHSDTEVIVHGYEEWGVEVFDHLNGMFGLAIWDARKRQLSVARDAMGIKPVYYRLDADGLTFGSEIRSIIAASDEKPQVDPTAVSLFLRYRFTPSPLTIFQGIRKLGAGTMLVCTENGCREVRWYGYKPRLFERMPTPEEASEELTSRYVRAVKRHLLSDVPVGLLLSGGLDSGLLLALMNREGHEWPTFTVGYGANFKDDELTDAARTAQLLGARHNEVHLTRRSFEAALPRVVASLEEPVAASSIVPMYFVCQRARQDVKVALMGQGPDELFGGYTRHLGLRYGPVWTTLPLWMRAWIAAKVEQLPRNETLKRGVQALAVPDRLARYRSVLSLLPGEQVDALFQEGALSLEGAACASECWSDLEGFMDDVDDLGGFQLLELRSTLPDELLMYADKLSMAHGLEVRVPFLDREVVEWVQCLDASFKVRRSSTKWLHRRVCRRTMPAEVLNRKKRGFAVNVVDDWLKGAVSGLLTDLLLDPQSKMFELLRPQSVLALYRDHTSARHDHHKILFSLAMLEQWLRVNDHDRASEAFIDRN